jgi:hypothetical protein
MTASSGDARALIGRVHPCLIKLRKVLDSADLASRLVRSGWLDRRVCGISGKIGCLFATAVGRKGSSAPAAATAEPRCIGATPRCCRGPLRALIDLQTTGVTLRRLERFWIHAADSVLETAVAGGFFVPGSAFFRLMHDLRLGGYAQGIELVSLRTHRTADAFVHAIKSG